MKTNTKSLLFPALVAALVFAGAGKSLANYDHDSTGWFDAHHQHHPFVKHHGHRGYWDTNAQGVKIFINV